MIMRIFARSKSLTTAAVAVVVPMTWVTVVLATAPTPVAANPVPEKTPGNLGKKRTRKNNKEGATRLLSLISINRMINTFFSYSL